MSTPGGVAPAAVLYTRANCTLCSALKRLAQRSARRHGVALLVRDVDADGVLRSRYGDRVPVLELPGGASFAGRAGAGAVDEAFRRAAHRPIDRGGLAWVRRLLGRVREQT